MKKLLTILLLVALFAGNTYAQFVSYGFLSTTGNYNEITGGTLVGTETSDDQVYVNPASPSASGNTGLGFPIGFNFVFNGITFDVLGINSNGWIGLGQSALTPAVNVQSTSSPLSSTTTFTPALLRNRVAAFSSDLQGQTGASMRIETIGLAPNRVCVVQYKNWKRYNTTGDVLNFQIRLLETSNEVQIVYGSMTAVATASTTEQVGLGGSVAAEFFNRTSTGSWSNSYPGTTNSSAMTFSNTIAPVSGQTYTFATMTPLAAVYQAPSNGALGMPINVNLTWTPNISGGAAPVGYKVYMGSDNPPTNIANGVNVGNVLTYAAPAPLALNTLYNWQIVPYNAIGDATGNATYNFTTTLGNGDLSGFVTNGFGIPLAGVTVNINNGMSNFSTVSAANGAYTFTAVNASPYTLTATLASYNTNVLNVSVAPNTTTYQNVVMLRPAMAITPNPYSVSVNPEEMVDGALNIANNGDGLLTWNASVSFTSPGPNTWLTLGQANGTVNAYTNYSLPVAFNASGLTSGTIKTAEITFTSTPNVGTVVIPVSMTVSGAALTAPTDFTVTLSNAVTGVASLDWNFTTVPSFQYFVVKRNGVQVATTTQSNYTDNLPAYGVYTYTVQAVFADGNSIPAGPVTIEWSNPTLVLTPASLYNEQYTNSSENVTFRIENTGEGTLAYSFPEYTSARGYGGPDAFGYEWIDSDESNGPAYTWTDITATGTAITGLSDDNVIGPFPIGFNFPFYENTYSSVNVSSNGYLIFGSTSSSLSNQNIPSTTEPNNVLAWCWDDLHGAGTGSTVYYKNVGDHWIIQFNNYHEYPSSGTGTITAQVHLYNNGDIKIYYNNLAGGFDVTSATVGVENNAGSIATKINYNTAYIHNGLAVAIDFPVPTFITAVSPAQGQVAPGAFVDVTATFTSNDIDFPVGTHTAELELTTNDLSNSTVMIPATMLVYQPGMIAGTVTSAVDGSPIFGATVTAGSYSTMTDEAGEYTITADAGTYAMTFSKTGYTSSTVTGVIVTETQTTTVDASLEEVIYPATLVHAEVNAADNQADVTWGAPNPDYEVLYDDGTAENYTAWALPGNMNAVKYTPAGYPATVYGGKIYVGDGSFPNNNTGFLGTTFGAMIMDASGANGMPGVVLDSIEVTVNNYGWVEFTGLDATIESGSFYLVMVQGAASPNVAGVGVDQTTPTSYRSYSRNVLAGGAWGLSPYQDMMIRAFVNGPASDDNAKSLASTEVRTPMKQRGMISLIPALAKSGAEGQGQFLAIQGNQSSREVTSYKVWRIAVANPDAGVQSGVLTLVDDAVSTTNYADAAFGPLPEGWYGYAVAANYTNGGESVKAYSNIVGHKKLVNVTVNVSLTTGASPAGTLVTLLGSDYPTSVYTQTVTETGTIVFEGVWKGNYTVLAEKVGFDDYTITANIQSNRTFNIVLAEKKYMPRNLYVDPLTLVATWDEPLAIGVAEDFEGTTFPPAGWNSYTQNTNGWYSTTDGSSSSFIIPPHTKYAVANDDEADGDGCCDYLWTPAMDLTDLPSYRLNFASYFTGEYGQTASVEISTDNAATWTVVYDMPAATGWQEIEVDLTQYSGANGLANAMIAFHTNDNGEWASGWAIDDVVIASGGVPHQGYGVFLDGSLVGNTPETTFTYTNLNYGQTYLAGVAALFTSGYSELDTYRFTSVYLIPPTNLQGDSPETDYVNLTWLAPTANQADANQAPLPVITAQPSADKATSVNAHSFAQTNVPLASSRDILFDNGPLVNSPGTGNGGADESILQGDLGMTTYGSGMQQTAGNSVAEDFTVTGTWSIDNFEFFGYQTGSTTTSTMTGVFFRIWDGDPSAGGTIIYGDLTTNKLVSTEWSNIYRNDNGPGGSTDRPVMRIVAGAEGLTLTAGTYWVEWCAAGSLSSGPWVPAVTIPGQTTTGNALQNISGSWAPLTDVGPQGMPFIINGSGGGQSVANLMGYNVYRDNALVAYVEKPNLTYTDLNLAPATYSYHITAVYDLTPYGFAGQTGESVMEGPINVDVIYGYELPFVEEFTTGLFETNKWTVNGGNWRIAGQQGNTAPSAEFTYAPTATNYDQSITSYYLIGAGMIDGSIKLDFDLKHTLINPSETEILAVEVNNGSGWTTAAQYKNTESFDWTTKSLDITSRAKDHVFRIRFVAKGENTLNINNWLIDNVKVYRICEAPTNLEAAINTPHGDQILLTWDGPETPTGISGWLKWDDGTNAGNGVGLTNGGTFLAAARFTPEQLTQYAGTSLTKIRIFPYQAAGCTFELKVWTGANAGTLVASQPVTITSDEWNEFTLTSPVYVSGSTELWIGYSLTHAAGQFPGGADAGPAVAGYGDMISTDGSTWDPMSTFGLDYNWNLEGFVETVDGVNMNLQPIADHNVYSANATVALSPVHNVNNPFATVMANNSSSRELTGYNVFRNDAFIANTSETTYLDTDATLTVGNEYCYKVTAVYEDCESDYSNTDCEVVQSTENLSTSSVSIYPNPSNSIVNIDLTGDIAQVVIYNYAGQVVYEQVITKDKNIQIDVHNYNAGAYLVKFITKSGESFAKKVAVTK